MQDVAMEVPAVPPQVVKPQLGTDAAAVIPDTPKKSRQ